MNYHHFIKISDYRISLNPLAGISQQTLIYVIMDSNLGLTGRSAEAGVRILSHSGEPFLDRTEAGMLLPVNWPLCGAAGQ
jgi:hypothetical protein